MRVLGCKGPVGLASAMRRQVSGVPRPMLAGVPSPRCSDCTRLSRGGEGREVSGLHRPPYPFLDPFPH